MFCDGEFHVGGGALADTREGVLAVAKTNILIDAQTDDSALAGQMLQLRVNLAGNSIRDVPAGGGGNNLGADGVNGPAGVGRHNGNGGHLLVGGGSGLGRSDIIGDGYVEVFGDDELTDEQEEDYQQKDNVDNGCHVESGDVSLPAEYA